MKKIISILLVAMLVIGMFPATALTALAADTYEKATSIAAGDTVILVCESKKMEMSTIGSKKYGEGVTYSTAPAGKVPLTVEEGYTSGTYSFKAPAGTYLYWTSGNYLQLNGTKNANTSWTVTFSGGNAVIKNAKDSARQILWNASSPRFSAYTSAQTAIQLYKLSTGSSTCEHTNQTEQNDGYAATCTKDGKTNSFICDDCGEIAVAQQTIPATNHKDTTVLEAEAVAGTCQQAGTAAAYSCSACGATWGGESTGIGDHNYEEGECTVCGAEQPAETEVTISFATTDHRVSQDSNSQVWANGGVTFTNNKAASTNAVVANYNPVRLYANSALVIEAPGNIVKIVFNCNTAAYATTLGNSVGAEATVSDKVVTVTPNADATIYNIDKLTAQVRVDSMVVTYASGNSGEPECEHTNTTLTGVIPAECGKPGYSGDYVCDDCGEIAQAGSETEALSHNYVDGTCTLCGAEKPDGTMPATELVSGNYVIVATVGGKSYAMSHTAENGKQTSQEVDVADTLLISKAGDDLVWTIEVTGNVATIAGGGKFLGYGSSGTNLTRPSEAYDWSVGIGDGGFTFTSTIKDDRGIIFRAGDFNLFGGYATSNSTNAEYDAALTLYKVETPVAEANGETYLSVEAAYEADPTATIKLLAAVENVTINGELYLDLNGKTASVTATKIYAYDSTATTSSTEFAALTTTSEVDMDNTVNGKRYIALKNDTAYTFHVLEMALTKVSLRTTAAGLYYTAKITCDETLAKAVDSYGVALSLYNMPGADFKTEYDPDNGVKDKNAWTVNNGSVVSGKEFTSGSVFGILKSGAANNDARGKLTIYANAYIMIDGAAYMANDTNNNNGAAKSLKDVMVAVDAMYATSDQKEIIWNFYDTWRDVMSGWGLTNLANAANPAA